MVMAVYLVSSQHSTSFNLYRASEFRLSYSPAQSATSKKTPRQQWYLLSTCGLLSSPRYRWTLESIVSTSGTSNPCTEAKTYMSYTWMAEYLQTSMGVRHDNSGTSASPPTCFLVKVAIPSLQLNWHPFQLHLDRWNHSELVRMHYTRLCRTLIQPHCSCLYSVRLRFHRISLVHRRGIGSRPSGLSSPWLFDDENPCRSTYQPMLGIQWLSRDEKTRQPWTWAAQQYFQSSRVSLRVYQHNLL